jgi:hypothetical protein
VNTEIAVYVKYGIDSPSPLPHHSMYFLFLPTEALLYDRPPTNIWLLVPTGRLFAKTETVKPVIVIHIKITQKWNTVIQEPGGKCVIVS